MALHTNTSTLNWPRNRLEACADGVSPDSILMAAFCSNCSFQSVFRDNPMQSACSNLSQILLKHVPQWSGLSYSGNAAADSPTSSGGRCPWPIKPRGFSNLQKSNSIQSHQEPGFPVTSHHLVRINIHLFIPKLPPCISSRFQQPPWGPAEAKRHPHIADRPVQISG